MREHVGEHVDLCPGCRWNFTPSPGWTVEESATLRLLLMDIGIGRWVQILGTGLLPGKLIQQLYGATQRLLGQQSLAAFTGLRLDVDRIRAENEARTDAPRKSGLIIYDGREWQTGLSVRMAGCERSISLDASPACFEQCRSARGQHRNSASNASPLALQHR